MLCVYHLKNWCDLYQRRMFSKWFYYSQHDFQTKTYCFSQHPCFPTDCIQFTITWYFLLSNNTWGISLSILINAGKIEDDLIIQHIISGGAKKRKLPRTSPTDNKYCLTDQTHSQLWKQSPPQRLSGRTAGISHSIQY